MRPSSGVSKAGEHPQQRGLAAAARPNSAKNSPRPDVEREPVHRAEGAEILETPSMRSNGASAATSAGAADASIIGLSISGDSSVI